MNLNLIVLGVILVLIVILTLVGSRQKKWYTVFMANNDVFHVYRKTFDWWLIDISGMIGFHDENDKVVKVSKHYIIKIKEGILPIPTPKE